MITSATGTCRMPRRPSSTSTSTMSPRCRSRICGDALVDDEPGRGAGATGSKSRSRTRERSMSLGLPMMDSWRAMPVAQPHRHRPVGLGAQHAGQALDRLQGAAVLLVGEVEGRVLAVGAEERHVDHQLDGVEGEQRRHQQAHGQGDAERRRARTHRPARHVAQRHDGQLRERQQRREPCPRRACGSAAAPAAAWRRPAPAPAPRARPAARRRRRQRPRPAPAMA